MTRAATGPCSDKDTFVVAAPPSSSLASPVPSARQAAWDSTGQYRPAQPTSVSSMILASALGGPSRFQTTAPAKHSPPHSSPPSQSPAMDLSPLPDKQNVTDSKNTYIGYMNTSIPKKERTLKKCTVPWGMGLGGRYLPNACKGLVQFLAPERRKNVLCPQW